MGSGGRRTAERRVKIKNRVRKQLAPWMSVKVMFYISKDQSQLIFVEGEDLYCRLVMKWRD